MIKKQPFRHKLRATVNRCFRRESYSFIPLSPCKLRSIREWVRCVASGERDPGSNVSDSRLGVMTSCVCDLKELCASGSVSLHGGRSLTWGREAGTGRLRRFVSKDLNGVHVRLRPLLMQLVHGNEPLQRFFDERQAVHAVLARKRLAGRTLGRAMIDEVSLGRSPQDKRGAGVRGPTFGRGTRQ
jgi:hypothetical protein